MDGVFENSLNVQLLHETLAQILGEQYGAKITVTVRPKVPPEGKGNDIPA